MTNEQTQQIIDMVQTGVNQLSEKMGVALPNLWAILVKQQYVVAVQELMMVVAAIAIQIVLFTLLKHANKEVGRNRDWEFGRLLIWLAIIAFIIVVCVKTGDVAARLINPEYYAIQEVVSYIKDGSPK